MIIHTNDFSRSRDSVLSPYCRRRRNIWSILAPSKSLRFGFVLDPPTHQSDLSESNAKLHNCRWQTQEESDRFRVDVPKGGDPSDLHNLFLATSQPQPISSRHRSPLSQRHVDLRRFFPGYLSLSPYAVGTYVDETLR